ncbi:MAG: AAA family ATPase [Acidimicrobiia bacterium]|nr:AAA family ATPase [Acidimicrobiia bacterium]MDH3470573.1 AAA family ATPase [Acidimicrobiia bacterium]
MAETITFEDPSGEGKPVELEAFSLPRNTPDRAQRAERIPKPDPFYVDLGMLYRMAQLERVRRDHFTEVPLHLALRGHMGTGKDHDLEQFAALLRLPYYRVPLTGEVRDITLIGSVKLYGDDKGGTESRWEDGDITRALRGPSLINLSELNAAGAETLFALHGLLDRYQALGLPTGETVPLRQDVRVFGTMNPTDLRDYAGTQTLNKAFADRWVIWEKSFPTEEQLAAMLERRYPDMGTKFVELIARLAAEVNTSFTSLDTATRVETPMSLRTVLDRLPAGLRIYEEADDPLIRAWDEFVLPHVDPYDRDHYSTVWSAVARKGPAGPVFS